MKVNLAFSALLVLCLLLKTEAPAQTLVEDTNVGLSLGTATIYQDIAGTDPTSIWFSVTSGPSSGLVTLTFDDFNLDEGSDWYLAELDDVFSETSISNGVHILWGGAPNIIGGTIEVPLGDVYLGINTGSGYYDNFRDTFGWAQFNIDDQLNVTLVDNAVAYQSSQIIIGRNAIPEPACSFFLFSLALANTLIRPKRQ